MTELINPSREVCPCCEAKGCILCDNTGYIGECYGDAEMPVLGNQYFDSRTADARIKYIYQLVEQAKEKHPLDHYTNALDRPEFYRQLEQIVLHGGVYEYPYTACWYDETEDDLDGDLVEEMFLLAQLRREFGIGIDWCWGHTFIENEYWPDYAIEELYDTGVLDRDGAGDHWLVQFIDQDALVDFLQQDYIMLSIGNDVYWVRND